MNSQIDKVTFHGLKVITICSSTIAVYELLLKEWATALSFIICWLILFILTRKYKNKDMIL